MARTKVITETFMAVKKPAEFGGRQVRKVHSEATSKRLIHYRGCIASTMRGKTGSYMDIRKAFAEAAKSCAGKLRSAVE